MQHPHFCPNSKLNWIKHAIITMSMFVSGLKAEVVEELPKKAKSKKSYIGKYR